MKHLLFKTFLTIFLACWTFIVTLFQGWYQHVVICSPTSIQFKCLCTQFKWRPQIMKDIWQCVFVIVFISSFDYPGHSFDYRYKLGSFDYFYISSVLWKPFSLTVSFKPCRNLKLQMHITVLDLSTSHTVKL